MRRISLLALSVLLLSLSLLPGCGSQPTSGGKGGPRVKAKGDAEDHDHGPGPHGGTILDFGKWHAEFTVNHKNKEATVYILDGDAKKAVPIALDKAMLSIKTPQFQVELKAAPDTGDPEGKSSRYVGKHDNLGKEQEFEGTLSGLVDGKQYTGDFKEEPEGKKEEKK